MIFKWRVTGPLDLSDSGDWRYQITVHSQTLEELSERFDQLSLGSMGCSHQPKCTGLILNQPTLTFPSRQDWSTTAAS